MALAVLLQNDGTGTKEQGNYDYRVLLNTLELDSGRVEDFDREKGWRELIREVLRASIKEGWKA